MEKENLDDLMREKFDTDDPGARFEFREEYWEQAQAMLEADERKRKRRFLWWWWLGAGCLLLAVGGWFGYAHSGGGDQPGTGQTTSLPKTGDATNAQGNNELGKKNNDPNAKPIESSKDGTPADQSAATTASGIPTAAGNQANWNNTQAVQSSHPDESARGSAPGGAKAAGGTHAPGNQANRNTQTAQLSQADTAGGRSPIRPDGQRTKSSGLLPATNTAAPTTGLPKQNTGLTPAPATTTPPTPTGLSTANTGPPSLTATATPTGLPTGNTGLTPATITPQPTGKPVGNAGNLENAGNATNVGILGVSPMPVLQKLPPIDFQTLATPPNIPFFPKAPQAAQEIKPLREPRFSLGLGASASAFFQKNKAAQLGGTAGIFADYRLSRSFSLNAGVAWRYIPIGIVADSTYEPPVSEQLRYSFGYDLVRTSIRPRSLHTLELPIALRWHRGAWHLEGGAALSRLLGVRANLMEERSTSLQPLPLTSKKKIWTDAQPYRQMWVSPMVGAGWQRGRWSVSLRAVLFPLDVAPPLIPDEPRATGLRPNVDVGLRYRIF